MTQVLSLPWRIMHNRGLSDETLPNESSGVRVAGLRSVRGHGATWRSELAPGTGICAVSRKPERTAEPLFAPLTKRPAFAQLGCSPCWPHCCWAVEPAALVRLSEADKAPRGCHHLYLQPPRLRAGGD